MEWEIVIGLEVHTQLSTSSKIFSGASTAYGAEPNTQADAVSIALPGVLPVLNKGAVERAIRFGLATGAHIAPRSVFARKNYFYPDLPKGYQISQFDLPVVGNGQLAIQVPAQGKQPAYEKTVRITRAHLEEDAGKSLHEDFHGMTGIDLNRAGTPLLEIVSEPDMRSAAEAVAYAKALHSLVRWIGICDGNMQEGSFRCDVNVSVRRPGEPLGTRREIKNLNSFKFMQQAIDYEVQWQIDTLENGGKIRQATVLFDPDKGETHEMRSKEEAHDYRYFPDPDLLPLDISEAWKEQVRATLPELPQAKQERYVSNLGLSAYDASILTSSRGISEYFESVANDVSDKKLVANWIIGEVSAALNDVNLSIEDCPVPPRHLAELLNRVLDQTITAKSAKLVFEVMWEHLPRVVAGVLTVTTSDQEFIAFRPDNIIRDRGLLQVSDSGAIEKIVDEIITANPAQVAEYRGGKEKVFGFFVGLAMKASKGKANPAQLNEVLKRKLSGE
ncbi:MAG TPA: Asp-tRNA(Asn)/Glu-tRNA(Gln) amidotransferase subunit GatB [Gallionella sp.]|nr:Asp-tRNA(Asn)/Glu-tRNA(Gln) amidotransferase subunit GatB [Gallionella sp.]